MKKYLEILGNVKILLENTLQYLQMLEMHNNTWQKLLKRLENTQNNWITLANT